jgi:hypothetical protein
MQALILLAVPYLCPLTRFWLSVQDLKRRPLENVAARAQEIWQEFLAEGAPSSINLDSHSYELTSHNLKDPGRYSYEDAQVHISLPYSLKHICMHAHTDCQYYCYYCTHIQPLTQTHNIIIPTHTLLAERGGGGTDGVKGN